LNYSQPIPHQEHHPAYEEGHTAHDGVAERGAEGDHQEPDTYPGDYPHRAFVLYREEEIDEDRGDPQEDEQGVDTGQDGLATVKHGVHGGLKLFEDEGVDEVGDGYPGSQSHHEGKAPSAQPGQHPREPEYHEDAKEHGDKQQVLGLPSRKNGDEEGVVEVGFQGIKPGDDDRIAQGYPYIQVFHYLKGRVILVEETVHGQGEACGNHYPKAFPAKTQLPQQEKEEVHQGKEAEGADEEPEVKTPIIYSYHLFETFAKV